MAINLKINGDGMAVDREISLTQAGKIITFLGSESEMAETTIVSPQLIQAGLASVGQLPDATDRRSVREMIDAAEPKTHAQKIAVFGQFIAQSNEVGLFTSDEIKSQYQAAREKLPLKFKREMDSSVSAGFIEPDRNDKNSFFVTRKGEDAIASSFKSATKARAKSKPASTKSTAITEDSVSDKVKAIQPVLPNLDGFPNYHKLKTKGFKIMWILAMAQVEGIESLSTKEIAYFAGKLRDRIEIRDISGHTVTGAKNGWVTKDNSANYSILHDGEEHLKTFTAVDELD